MPGDHAALPLSDSTSGQLAVRTPSYARGELAASIVHIGVGGFHRAHFATYVHDLCAQGNVEWAIAGAGVLAGDTAMADALRAQDHLYTLITHGPSASTVEVIGSIVDFIGPDAPDTLVAKIADAGTQLVSLTVTEGGYPIDDQTGAYRSDSAAAGPGSAFARLAAGLDRRRHEDGGPVSVVSFDNIIANGTAARTSTLGEAQAVSAELAAWVEEHVSFPNSMVDRITPATTPADLVWLESTHGVIDRWPVVTEPFRQWVVEDEFAGQRPPLEDLDVIVTTDVEPYELMKLRLLNAAHSCLAYLSALADIDMVHEAMADPSVHRFVVEFLEREAAPTVPAVAGIDLGEYTSSLVERFTNPRIGDQISRLCLDGSAKFPKFLLPTIRSQLERGGPVERSALALAGWCEYLGGRSDSGAEIVPARDPLLRSAQDAAAASQSDPAAFLGFSEVFGSDLPAAGRFRDAFVRSVGALRSTDVRSAITQTLDEIGSAG